MQEITFITDDNTEETMYVICDTRVNGSNYLLVTDTDDESDDEAEVFIMKGTSGDDEATAVYEFVENDDELDSVARIFETILEDVDIE